MPLQSGVLRRRVTVERLADTPANPFGEQAQTADRWSAVRVVWAGVEAISAREIVQSERTQTSITYKVRMRRQDDLTTKDRLRWDGGVLNIQSILLRGQRLEEQELLCAQQVD